MVSTAYRERVSFAVNDRDWQTFRRSLKGLSTEEKLRQLCDYYDTTAHSDVEHVGARRPTFMGINVVECAVCIRVDNYLKALARGGQLTKPMRLDVALDHKWDLQILK